ncbi:MAG: urea carboxylase [Pseudomonadota bacterium]
MAKVLIANRGAIAVRIVRTLTRMGIASVAVYADQDAQSLHVRHADEAWSLGAGAAAATYLNVDAVLAIARESGATAVHPGYGFLSENADFVRRVEAAGLTFIGPTPAHIEAFGLKHRARALAEASGMPLLPGTGLLADCDAALAEAEAIGYPVMLKSTAGGGGIGMQRCDTPEGLADAFESVKRLGASNFADDGVFLEKFIARARHIEVQVFGDGHGVAVAVGERDCSAQRRNQKVIEECPAPHLSEGVRTRLLASAEALLASVQYRNAGTVEFVVDSETEAFYFLEVNTRLQVEHGVTEAVFGLDLVAWMVQLADGTLGDLAAVRRALMPQGHAIQVRLYAEDPFRAFQPCPGLLTHVVMPGGDGVRVDHWVEAGVEVPPDFDPMLGKLIVHDADRAAALAALGDALDTTEIEGTETNLDYLRALIADSVVCDGRVTTRYLNEFRYQPVRIDVVRGGTQTTVQDAPGRQGYWHVGVPPSGPFDRYSFQLGNRLLGNPSDAAGLEMLLEGPELVFHCDTEIVLSGADFYSTLDSVPVERYRVVPVRRGQRLCCSRVAGAGARAYLCIRGGVACTPYLGSRSTFTLGRFGGVTGRALRVGDVLRLGDSGGNTRSARCPTALRPAIEHEVTLRVVYGPHGAPDFFTEQDIASFFDTPWEVHFNSSRTGVRLIGPKPQWARTDGGEAGLHPSNIHDNAYAFGTVDFTGDMPVILGPDGPSLGGFVCPVTVITADLWKLGQLSAGDRVRFTPVSIDTAIALAEAQSASLATLTAVDAEAPVAAIGTSVLGTLSAEDVGETVVYRAAGDSFVLVEYGDQVLDLRLRFRVHALMQWLEARAVPGVRELTPGIRSLQVHFDFRAIGHADLLALLQEAEAQLSDAINTLEVPSRTVYLPLSWDDVACQAAVDKYQQLVRPDAPWCPSNLEFIRRINGLDSIEAVKRTVFDASYLVMGLGDVYLGAPVATPVNPAHRLVTTKYNPARTWTEENSVGIGGSYLCVYGMEGPGGYQFIGRTLQMWNRHRTTADFSRPWLLRFFDQIRFYEVSHEALETIRRDFPCGRFRLRTEEGVFRLGDYEAFLAREAGALERIRQSRATAFEAELARWHANGQFHYDADEAVAAPNETTWPAGSEAALCPVAGSLWRLEVSEGTVVAAGDTVAVLESMKMEIPVPSPAAGVVTHVLGETGRQVSAGQALIIIQPDIQDTSHG